MLQRPCEPSRLFGDGGLDRSGNRRDQGRFCRRAQVQGGTHFLSKDLLRRFRRFYGFDGTVQLRSSQGCSGSSASKNGPPFTSIGNPNPAEAVPRGDLGGDGSSLRSRRRRDVRSEYSGPNANRPIGRASGPGANRVHSHRAPAQRDALRVRTRRCWAEFVWHALSVCPTIIALWLTCDQRSNSRLTGC